MQENFYIHNLPKKETHTESGVHFFNPPFPKLMMFIAAVTVVLMLIVPCKAYAKNTAAFTQFKNDYEAIETLAGLGELEWHILDIKPEWDSKSNVGRIYIGKEPVVAERSGMLTLHYDQQDRLYKSVLFVFDFEKDIEEYAAWAISTLLYMSPRSDLDDIGNALSLEEDKMIPTDGLWETYDTLDHIEIYQRAERMEQTGEAAIQVTLLNTAIQPNL